MGAGVVAKLGRVDLFPDGVPKIWPTEAVAIITEVSLSASAPCLVPPSAPYRCYLIAADL